jgi:hypothetical protein
MQEVKIISLSGFIGSGKTEVANLISDQFGYKPLMLAGLAKSVVSQVYGVSLEELENRKYKERYRPLIIQYAEKMKEIDLYVHCKYVYELIKKELTLKGNGKILISDIRWPYESLYFRKFDRCSQHVCEMEYEGFKGYEVSYTPLYIESNLADNSSKLDSESHYEYLKKTSQGVIFNGTEERYDRNRLVNQLVKFV